MQGKKRGLNYIYISFASILLFALILFYTFRIEPNCINTTYTHLEFGIENPIKIAFISDIHSDTVSSEFLHDVVKKINLEEPDYILLGGDYISNKEDDLFKLSELSNLRAKKGKYAVIGNHDYDIWNEVGCSQESKDGITENISSYLEELGITVLKNQNVELEKEVVLIGLDDFWSCKTNYLEAMQGTQDYDVKIILAHNQDSVSLKEIEGSLLLLAGHTHCGQIRLPIIGSIPKTFYNFSGEFEMGHHEIDEKMHIYTTCGIGGGPRFLASPEITIIEIS